MICSTPRAGATALLEALRGACPGAHEYPDATEHDGIYVTMVHWAQMPVTLPEADETKYVRLYRSDRNAQAVSWAVAAGTGRFHSTQPPRTTDPDVTPGDIAVLRSTIHRADLSWQQWLDGKPTLNVCYERDLNGRYEQGAREILAWCGIPGEPAPVTLRPVDVDLKESLLNRWAKP